MTKTMRHRSPMTVLLLATVLLAPGCATPRDDAGSRVSAQPDEPLLTTARPITVISRDEKVELCLGGVLESLPPVCAGGLELIGWDWDALGGQYEESGEVRWGEFVVTGTYDPVAATFAPVRVSPGAEHDEPERDPMGPVLGTRCETPEGGWRILDEAKATQEALHATTAAASALEGYATTWLDRALLPPVPKGADVLDELHHYAVSAGFYILNVAVRGDAAEAEAILRRKWGGALCVFAVDYTQAELDERLRELMAEGHPWVGAHADGMTGIVSLAVIHDAGGALQHEMDERYGPGLVRISSVLQPVMP